MGLDPEVMRRMSLWQFAQYRRGFEKFNAAPDADQPVQAPNLTEEEFFDLFKDD